MKSPSIHATVDRFISYAAASGADDSSLYGHLVAIDRKQPEARSLSIDQARGFVEGEPPYEGQFAARPAAIGQPFAALAAFADTAQQIDEPTAPALVDLIVALWGKPWAAIAGELASDAFAEGLDRVWQNVFALECMYGYDRDALAAMTRAIVGIHVLRRMAESRHGEDLETEWPSDRLRTSLDATLVLPAPVFPLPADGMTSVS